MSTGVYGWKWFLIVGVVLAFVLYVGNRWLNTPISATQTLVLVALYLSQYGMALLGIYWLSRRKWAMGIGLLFVQLLTVEHLVYHAVYGVLPDRGHALHHQSIPFIQKQFRARVMSGYVFVMLFAGGTYILAARQRVTKQRNQYKRQMEEMTGRLQLLERKEGQLLMGAHFMRSMLVTVAEYARHHPGKRATELSGAFISLVEYAIKASGHTGLVHAATEWHQVENLVLLANAKAGRQAVVVDGGPEYAWGLDVPAFCWLTLVENALVHGDTTAAEPIRIALCLVDNATVFRCTNPLGHKTNNIHPQGGQGLPLLRERLRMAFGEQAVLQADVEMERFQAILTIQDR